jgi:glycine/D-amino acid oxidase-like deaminating enzyme
MPLTASFWLDHAHHPAFSDSEPTPARTSVAVIGGGITGASIAYWLARLGVDCVLLERRGLSGGATGRNGGHIVPGPALAWDEAVRAYGAEGARAIWDFTVATTRAVEALVTEHQIQCDLQFPGTAVLALRADELDRLRGTAEALARAGLPHRYWDAATCAEQTQSESFLGGVFNPLGGQLWPAKLGFGIAEQAARLGAHIHPHTDVIAVERAHGQFMIQTERAALLAENVVYAGNAWTRQLLPGLNDIIVPVRGQVIITQPFPRMWPMGLVADEGYEYWIQRPDGRIVLGGLRRLAVNEELGVDDDGALNPVISRALRQFLPARFPALQAARAEGEWAGIMAFTPDRNPLVGPVPGRPGEYIAAGYSGHGMPIAFGAGQAIAEMIAGRMPERYVEAFTPKRFEVWG